MRPHALCPFGVIPRTDGGFTMFEIMAVVLIIGILLGIAVAAYVPATTAAAAAACHENQTILNRAFAVAATDNEAGSPTTLEDLSPYVRDIDSATTCPLDGTPLTFDAATGTISCPNHP